jgi:hypothetical protein
VELATATDGPPLPAAVVRPGPSKIGSADFAAMIAEGRDNIKNSAERAATSPPTSQHVANCAFSHGWAANAIHY